MEQRQTLHFIHGSSRVRAELSRASFDLGHHAEVYGSTGEFAQRPPSSGIVLVHDCDAVMGVSALMQELGEHETWLPCVAMYERPTPGRIVGAIRSGALDYLSLPIDADGLQGMISRVSEDAAAHGEARQRMMAAQGRIAKLSKREREVLDWLSEGSSNKIIARELEISPRTVEIHRANMMTKLGARHSAEAIRMRIEASVREKIPA